MGTTDEILKFEELDDNRDLRIGFLVPMGSLRKTLMSVMKKTPFGMEHLIIGPNDLAKSYYDILIVDETHRLARYKNLQSRGKFLDSTRKIMPEIADDEEKIREATQLDWVLRRSRIRIMLFDGNQTVRGSDEDPRRIHDKLTQSDAHYKEFWLTSQMRCMGGESYISYISDLLNCRVTEKKEMADGFRFEMFDDVDEMVDTIKKLDAEFGLCRTVAGFGWDWITNAKRKHSDPSAYDINIGRGYRWNGNTDGWVLRMDSVDEIGCVHSTQGFDLNYVGVIFGPEIDYDPDKKRITFNRDHFYDKFAKQQVDEEDVGTYIINAYKVLLTRGIHGCFVYVYNEPLRAYLRNWIDAYSDHDDVTDSI